MNSKHFLSYAFELCKMNAAQAKQIDLPALLAGLGHQQQPVTREGFWYFSPFREEDTPSFKVWQLPSGWCWKDFGSGEGGNVIGFANLMIGKQTSDTAISDALAWLRGQSGVMVAQALKQPSTASKSGRVVHEKPERFSLVDNKRLASPQLISYLAGRGIPGRIAQAYCGQANYLDNQSKRKFFGISFPNIDGGLEIRAATEYKHHVNTGLKNISFIPGHDKQAKAICVFEGFIDFLSYLALTRQDKPANSAIVLNSTSFAGQAAEYIRKSPIIQENDIKTLIMFLDNNAAGEKAFNRMAEILDPEGYRLGDCRYLYQDHNLEDLNDYLTKIPGANIQLEKVAPKFFDDNNLNARQKDNRFIR